jgi:hypothetical protein
MKCHSPDHASENGRREIGHEGWTGLSKNGLSAKLPMEVPL